ncbi:MAG TPA: aldo/keto reductase [Steroidobacteraceae bacterium]|nr:aldo/keto reductase [Steroidobacteraceae bacterium]
MQMRSYGSSGLRVPVLGFGAMQVGDPSLDEAQAARLLHHVLDAGLTLLDTARSYGLAEERIGRVLAHRRDEFVLSTKVGYGIPGVPDWTYDCVIAGVDAARSRLRTDVIDIVHLHSCGRDTLAAGEVTRALTRCREQGKIKVAAYSGDGDALRFAISLTSPAPVGEVGRRPGEGEARLGTSPAPVGEVGRRPGEGSLQGLQASVNLCDQQALPLLRDARTRGVGIIAKRSLAGRPWQGAPTGDAVHDEYRRRFETLCRALSVASDDWDATALRFTAFAPGVDCVIVGGTDAAKVDRNVATIALGPLEPEVRSAITGAFGKHGRRWEGLV